MPLAPDGDTPIAWVPQQLDQEGALENDSADADWEQLSPIN